LDSFKISPEQVIHFCLMQFRLSLYPISKGSESSCQE
jgi:hypothetical protein